LVTEEEMRKKLEALRIEHRDLDAAIDALTLSGAGDQMQLARPRSASSSSRIRFR
jgi:hypothetical protein